jgi:hypothetical protein
MAIIAVAISVYVLLVASLANVSFSELRFLPGGRRSINSDYRAIYGNNTNDNSRNDNKPISSEGANSFPCSLNTITNTTKTKSLQSQTKLTEITKLCQKGVDKFGIAGWSK